MITIYHNPRCSKSRQALALIEEKGITPTVVKYLETPLTESDIKNLLKLLGKTAHEIIRDKEEDYKNCGLSKDSDEATLIKAMIKHPKLIERPIVVKEKHAVIGRPPENVLALL